MTKPVAVSDGCLVRAVLVNDVGEGELKLMCEQALDV
jgi:hypothetical protein